jgi:hypothetical protein
MFSLLLNFIFKRTSLAKYLDLVFKNAFHNFGFGSESSKRLIPQSSVFLSILTKECQLKFWTQEPKLKTLILML